MAEGSYTVEAAFLVPMILGIAFALMAMLFVLHDRVILQANVKNAVFLTVEEEFDGKDFAESAEKNLWYTQVEDAQLNKGLIKVEGEACGSARFDIPVMQWFLSARQKSEAKITYQTLQPEQVIRGKKILNGSDEGKEGDSDGGVEGG